jgi:hypothetical protein
MKQTPCISGRPQLRACAARQSFLFALLHFDASRVFKP